MPASRTTWPRTAVMIAVVTVLFLSFSSAPQIWPLRNALAYQSGRWLAGQPRIPPPDPTTGVGALRGRVYNAHGEAVPGALVLVAAPDGSTFSASSDATGQYAIDPLPAGSYVPVAGAAGYNNAAVRPWGMALSVAAGEVRSLDITLPPVTLPEVVPGRDLQFGEPFTSTWQLPVPSVAVSRTLRFDSGGRPNQLAILYTPITTTRTLPLLIAVYPGPADSWWPVSVPLASAGYSVLAVGPDYALDLEPDVAELQRLVAFARAGRLPGVDGGRIALLGGSYSSMHVLRLLERDVGFRGAVLLGPPSDLFDMRRRFEEGSIFPPFGLDQALIALGTPDRTPENYWRYSAVYHLRGDTPPMLLLHSRQDEIIPYQQSELLAAALERAGAPYELHLFDGMKHYLLATEPSAELTQLYDLTLAFLKRNLRAQ